MQPYFAVVGHPNKGKSSVVAALTQQDQVAISDISGTTTEAQTFQLQIDGETLYSLVDTPGFQRPRQMLEALQNKNPNASARVNTIREFIVDHQASAAQTGRFKDEIELLTPILDGANIIYVVDGSVPYSAEYEAEMTILQWTGRPRMALINPISGNRFVEDWRQALNQFFSVVQLFNPMSAERDQQSAILSAFATLSPEWQNSLEHKQRTINNHLQHRQQQAAFTIATYLTEVLAYQLSLPAPESVPDHTIRTTLKTQYEHFLKGQEHKLHERLRAIYFHQNLSSEIAPLELNYPDLFDQGHWYLFGLSRAKLIALSAGAGAAAGVLIDLGLGGASLMMGSMVGGISSAAASAWLSESPEKIRLYNLPLGGKKLQIGPVKNRQFAFVMLGRALDYQKALVNHTHANRNPLTVSDSSQHWIEQLSKQKQINLSLLLKKAHETLNESELEQLQKLLMELIH